MVKVLYLDKEGGWGGSSRSLYFLLKNLDRSLYTPIVWYKSAGPMADRLADLGIQARHEPDMCSIIPRREKNWKLWIVNIPYILKLSAVADKIIELDPDLIHMNYEGLVPLLYVLRKKGCVRPVVLHVRTMSPANWIYKLYAKVINAHANHLVCITENERGRVLEAGVDPGRVPATVLYNPLDPALFQGDAAEKGVSEKLNLVFLGSIDRQKAADRLVELARELRDRNVSARITAYGRSPRYKKFFVFPIRNLERLSAQVKEEGLEEWLSFAGHIANPEERIKEADILLRPSRDNDPWGRDVLEALALGLPVMAMGRYDRFVVPGKTGWLSEQWDAGKWADLIASIDKNRATLKEMSRMARSHAASLLDSREYGRKISEIYQSLLK